MKILVLGAGAVGVYFGARLQQGGHDVAVVARSDYEVARQNGYVIHSYMGDFSFKPNQVLSDPGEYQEEADYIIVATKQLPGVDRVGMLKKVVRNPQTVIVLIQNGIGIEPEIAAAFPHNELLTSIAYIGVSRPSRGVLQHTGKGNLQIGAYPDGASQAAEKLCQTFTASQVPAEYHTDMSLVRWTKLLWNLPFNPVSVLAGGANTQELSSGALCELCSGLMDELVAVANAEGVPLTRDMADYQIAYTKKFPPYKTSMLQDFELGRHLEVDAILGNVVKLGRLHHLAIPRMECCYALLASVDAHITR